MEPADALQAATHADPYPFYARLRAGPPLSHDARLGLWIAARADVLDALFAHPSLRVRPPAEPVPRAIAGQPAGALFGRLVRMNDGAGHQPGKRAIEQALAAVDAHAVDAAVAHTAAGLQPRATDADALNRWLFELPVRSVARLLGFADAACGALAEATRAFVACLSPLATPAQLEAAHAAAGQLMDAMARAPRQGGGIAALLHARAGAQGWHDAHALAANLAGLLSQTYEATAGLVGSSLLALAAHPRVRERAAQSPGGWLAVARETARFDAPVQNTRRFAAEPVQAAGVDLPAGAAVLLVLAAANRDPRANPAPDAFDPWRAAPRLYSFSRGAHACPGQELACRIAAAALRALHDAGTWPDLRALRWSYRPSHNGRLPVFLAEEELTRT